MNHNNNETGQLLKPHDLRGIRNKHGELHALLVYICQGRCESFITLSGEQQQNLLHLALSASQAVADCLDPN